jgi:hypothetical protein
MYVSMYVYVYVCILYVNVCIYIFICHGKGGGQWWWGAMVVGGNVTCAESMAEDPPKCNADGFFMRRHGNCCNLFFFNFFRVSGLSSF